MRQATISRSVNQTIQQNRGNKSNMDKDRTIQHVVPLRKVIINLSKLASDMEWQGKWDKADRLYAEIEQLKHQERLGETWYPLF